MGILGKPLGIKQSQPYVDTGMALVFRLSAEFNLPDWNNGLPDYTPAELEAIQHGLDRFQAMADEEMGGNAAFHPDAVKTLQRHVAGEALGDYAQHLALEITGNQEGANTTDWRLAVSAYLKAWSSKLDPMTMLNMADFLARIDKKEAARAAYQVVLHVPTYAGTLWGEWRLHKPISGRKHPEKPNDSRAVWS
jgi:hypothetical protein